MRTPSAVGLDSWSPGAQPGLDRGDRRVLPGSWGTPCVHALLFDPGGTLDARPLRRRRCCLPLVPRRRLPRFESFEARLPRPAHSLSTLRSAGHPAATQDSLPVGGQPLPGRIRTYRVHYEGFPVLSTAYSFLPSQAWPGARDVSLRGYIATNQGNRLDLPAQEPRSKMCVMTWHLCPGGAGHGASFYASGHLVLSLILKTAAARGAADQVQVGAPSRSSASQKIV